MFFLFFFACLLSKFARLFTKTRLILIFLVPFFSTLMKTIRGQNRLVIVEVVIVALILVIVAYNQRELILLMAVNLL